MLSGKTELVNFNRFFYICKKNSESKYNSKLKMIRMQKTLFYLISLTLLLSSCSARISTSIQKTYPPVDQSQEIQVLLSLRDVPPTAELLGKVDVGDSGFTTNCSYDTVLNAAKAEARKIGGNMICIINHLTPDFYSSCHRISTNIYKSDFPREKFIISSLAPKPDNIQAQTQAVAKDTIEIIKKPMGYQYKYKGEMLSLSQLGTFLEKNNLSTELYKSAKGTSGFLNVLGFAGGFCIGYGLGPLLYGRQPNLALAGIGAGIIVVSLPILSSAENKLKRAVDIYNSGNSQSMYAPLKYEMNLALVPNGVGVVIKFE